MNTQQNSRLPAPRRPALRFLSVGVASALSGVAVALLSALIAAQIMKGRTTGIGDLVAVIVSVLIGFPVGVSAGLAVLKHVLRWPGSLLRGVVGAVLGALFVMLAAEPLRLNAESELLLLTYALCIVVFAVVGFVSRP